MEARTKTWITSQNKLAAAAGVHPMTVTRAKVEKFGISLENYNKLADLTGISVKEWAASPRSTLASKLRSFFRQQREAKILANTSR